MSTKKWRLVKDEENLAYYSSCNDIHVKAGSLIIQLRKILFELKNLQKRKEHTVYEKTEHHDVDIQALNAAVEKMQNIVKDFQSLTYRKQPIDVMKTEATVEKPVPRKQSLLSSGGSTETNTSNSSFVRPPPPPPPPKVSNAVFVYKANHLKEILRKDRNIIAYLTYQTVVAVLGHCNEVAQQNHGQSTLANMFRLACMYNDFLALTVKDNMSIATSCKNTCPILQHPLRKLSITKILQVLAQHRMQQSCYNLVCTLLYSYPGMDQFCSTSPGSPLCDEPTSPENTDNSSIEVYRALTRYMTPPCASVLPPVENSSQSFVTSAFDLTRIQKLIEIEEDHVTTLLAVAAISAPILLGRRGIKPSKTTGLPKVSKQALSKVVDYYQQVLWGEVGTCSENVILWCGPCPLGTMPIDICQQLHLWLKNVRTSGRVPPPVIPAVQSMLDGLCCHITSTKWDQLFRKTLVYGNQVLIANENGQECQGTKTGEMFAEVLHSLVTLSNDCEVSADWISGPPLEDLPLVEQIPVLHRLDHSVHTTRLWATNRARQLASSWNVSLFFLVSQADVSICLQELQQLHLADHSNFQNIQSEHVMVCAKMRAKLVSEVRQNIDKLKKVSEECITGMANVCRTVSLANLHMCFPDVKYWRQTRHNPQGASSYVQRYLDSVLHPVLQAVLSLPLNTQQTVGGMVMKILCEAWLDHIYIHRIKFSEWGAIQLLTDFASVPVWLEKQTAIPLEVQHHLMKNEVLRRCEGVGRLLLRRPGEPIAMIAPPTRARQVPDSPTGSQTSGGMDTMPAEMYVPNQEQWLELRAPRTKVLSLCCSS